ncbi:MAG: 16S rRNA (adenine(1518)-N(6)/adenine(1519)-N(6))-dimethyltransferase RsmA [Candidatus Acidiferrales bacterium]
MPRQRLGQHFLASAAWRERILRTLGLRADETWVEIGAGHGEMTQLLTGSGRRIIAIETDARLAAGLGERASAWPGVEVVGADALLVDFEALARDRFRVYGNLPYYITSPLLHRLFRHADAITSIHVVIQLEVALRIVAAPGRRDYGYLSVLCQYYSQPQIVFHVPPGAFRPPPRVTSALVRMQLPGERMALGLTDDASFLSFAQAGFGQKRKTLRNNLRLVAPAALVQAAIEVCGLSNNSRAEELTLRELADLYIRLHSA